MHLDPIACVITSMELLLSILANNALNEDKMIKLEAVGNRKPLPGQVISQNSYSWLNPAAVKFR